MEKDLFTEVKKGIRANKKRWHEIAKALPGISYSWLSQIGRGHYKSQPSYKRLRKVAEFLEKAE